MSRIVTDSRRGWRNPCRCRRAKALKKLSTLIAEARPIPARPEDEIPTLPTAAEVRLASVFHDRTSYDDWCYGLAQFDDRFLVGLPLFDAAAHRVRLYASSVTLDAGRNRPTALLVDCMVEGDVVTNKTG